jgi:hypothetical protein
VVAALHEATKEGSLVLNYTKTQAVYSISPDTPGFLTGNVKIYVVNDIIVLCCDMTLGGGGNINDCFLFSKFDYVYKNMTSFYISIFKYIINFTSMKVSYLFSNNLKFS